MTGYQSGDAGATSELIGRVSPHMFHFFVAETRNRAVAEDLLQDFWLRIHRARHTFRPGEPLLPWMYAIARRVRVDAYRKSVRVDRHEIRTESLPDYPAPGGTETSVQGSAKLAELLADLPAAQREVILLLKESGLTLEEVARVTGSSVGAVKQRAHRAYKKLRKAFGAE